MTARQFARVILLAGTAGDYVPMSRRVICVVASVAALLSGCASPAPPAPEPTETAVQTSLSGELTGSGTVLQKGATPPVFCLGAMTSSYPPQACGGPVTRNWDWSAVTGYERAAGVTWGSYTVTGTWDKGEFVRTREPAPVSPTETGIPGRTARHWEAGNGEQSTTYADSTRPPICGWPAHPHIRDPERLPRHVGCVRQRRYPERTGH